MKKITRIALTASGALALLAIPATQSFAATTSSTGTGTVTAGSLTFSVPNAINQDYSNSGSTALTGAPSISLANSSGVGYQVGSSSAFATTSTGGSSPMAQPSFIVNDQTGTGLGWSVTVQGSVVETAPSGGFATGTSAIKWPSGSLTLEAPTVAADGGQSSSLDPTVNLSGSTNIINSAPVTVVTAATNTGEGQWNVNFANNPGSASNPTTMLRYNIPITPIVDTVNYPTSVGPTPYTTTLTWTLTQG